MRSGELDEEEYAKFDAWCERKALERHERFMKAKAERDAIREALKAGGPEIPAGASSHTVAAPTTPAPAAVTSDERFAEEF